MIDNLFDSLLDGILGDVEDGIHIDNSNFLHSVNDPSIDFDDIDIYSNSDNANSVFSTHNSVWQNDFEPLQHIHSDASSFLTDSITPNIMEQSGEIWTEVDNEASALLDHQDFSTQLTTESLYGIVHEQQLDDMQIFDMKEQQFDDILTNQEIVGTLMPNDDTTPHTDGDIAFTGNFYDDQIKIAQDKYDYHVNQEINSNSLDDMKFHHDQAVNAYSSEKYWQNNKHEAEIMQHKHDIEREHYQNVIDIDRKYREDLENIYSGKND